jgi:hypothetical protein
MRIAFDATLAAVVSSRSIGIVVACAALLPASAGAAAPVSHAAYAKLLKDADARVTRATAPLERALNSKTLTVVELRRLMLASAAVSTDLGHRFAAVVPPERKAQAANRSLSHAELDLGAEMRTLARHLPGTPQAALAYLLAHSPKGGGEVDAALAALRAAGYDARS